MFITDKVIPFLLITSKESLLDNPTAEIKVLMNLKLCNLSTLSIFTSVFILYRYCTVTIIILNGVS